MIGQLISQMIGQLSRPQQRSKRSDIQLTVELIASQQQLFANAQLSGGRQIRLANKFLTAGSVDLRRFPAPLVTNDEAGRPEAAATAVTLRPLRHP